MPDQAPEAAPKAGLPPWMATFADLMTLLVRKVQLLVIGYSPLFVYPGAIGGLYAALKDLATKNY